MRSTLAVAVTLAACAACVVDHRLASEPSCLFGASTASRGTPGDLGERAAMEALERDVGRTMDLDRIFHQWDDAVPGDRERWTIAAGRTPLVSFNGRGAQKVSWQQVASGAMDAHLGQIADGFRALGARAFCIYHHEPDNDTPEFGDAADFRAAFRHVVAVFRAHGAANVVWSFNMKSPSFATLADGYYPGDDVVDWISASVYNFGTTQPGGRWLSLRALLSDFHDWATPKGKPLLLAEWATLDDPGDPARKPGWIADAADLVASWPEIRAMSYFDGAPATGKSYALESSPTSDAAFRKLAASPIFELRR